MQTCTLHTLCELEYILPTVDNSQGTVRLDLANVPSAEESLGVCNQADATLKAHLHHSNLPLRVLRRSSYVYLTNGHANVTLP